MSRILTLFFCFTIATETLKAQSLSTKDLRYIHDDIANYIGSREKLMGGPLRNSEYFVCLMNVDTAGKISSIRVLGDKKNLDSSFIYVSSMPVDVFIKRVFNECKGKTILLPVFSYTPKKVPQELKLIYESTKPGPLQILKEVGKMVYVSDLYYSTPTVSQ